MRLPWNHRSSICKDRRVSFAETPISAVSFSKRPGKSVSKSATTSPRRPRVLTTCATTIKSSERARLFNYFQNETTMLLDPGRINQRSQCANGSALFTYYLTHICLRHAYLDPRGAVTLNLANVDRRGIVDQSFYYHFDRVTHGFVQNPESKVQSCRCQDLTLDFRL